MPMFELNDGSGEGVEINAVRPTFKRGVRQTPPTIRRIRDILINILASLGMDPEDIAAVLRRGMTSRNIRNRLNETPRPIQSEIARLCHPIMKLAREKARGKPVRPEGLAVHAGRGNGVARRGRAKKQKTFLFDLDVEQLDGR